LNGHLVTITSSKENKFVKSLASGLAIWIGATDKDTEGKWVWINNEGPLNKSDMVRNWDFGQPDNWYGNEDYAEMCASGSWNDLPNDPMFYNEPDKDPRYAPIKAYVVEYEY
jgi:hypothetical protein